MEYRKNCLGNFTRRGPGWASGLRVSASGLGSWGESWRLNRLAAERWCGLPYHLRRWFSVNPNRHPGWSLEAVSGSEECGRNLKFQGLHKTFLWKWCVGAEGSEPGVSFLTQNRVRVGYE